MCNVFDCQKENRFSSSSSSLTLSSPTTWYPSVIPSGPFLSVDPVASYVDQSVNMQGKEVQGKSKCSAVDLIIIRLWFLPHYSGLPTHYSQAPTPRIILIPLCNRTPPHVLFINSKNNSSPECSTMWHASIFINPHNLIQPPPTPRAPLSIRNDIAWYFIFSKPRECRN